MTAMRMTMALVALGALGACTAGAQVGSLGAQGSVGTVARASAPAPAPMAPADRLVAAIERQGCVLTTQNAGAVLLQANMTKQESLEIVPQLAAQGRVEVSGDGAIRVLTQNCI